MSMHFKAPNPSLKDIFETLEYQKLMLDRLKSPFQSKEKPDMEDTFIKFPETFSINLKEKKSLKEIEDRLAKIRLDKFEQAGPQTGDILIWSDKTIKRLLVIKDKVAYTCSYDKTNFTILESGNAFVINPEEVIYSKEACISTDKLYKIGISAEMFVTPSLEEICIPVYMWSTI
jgi:hypothetical protein